MVSCGRGRVASDRAVTGWLPELMPGAEKQGDRREKEGEQVGEL